MSRSVQRSTNERKPTAVENRTFLDLWLHENYCLLANAPDLQSPTISELYHQCKENIETIVSEMREGKSWTNLEHVAKRTLKLLEALYPERRPIDDKRLLFYLTTRDHDFERASEIIAETHKQRIGRRLSAQVLRDSIRAYDLHLQSKNVKQIAVALCRDDGRNSCEKVRLWLRRVEQLLHPKTHARVK